MDIEPVETSLSPMQPVAFGGCFGWLHARPGPVAETAVLLCPGLGQDYSNAYRAFRLLANGLAEAGYAALRFDYPGTGDSAAGTGGNAWEAWLASVHAAATWLRAHTGARSLVLVGLRIGAALAAATAAAREDVRALALVEPVLHARSYATQLTTEWRLRGGVSEGSDGIEVGELALNAATLSSMRATDVAALRLPGVSRVAVFSRTRPAAFEERLHAWRAAGAALSCQELGGLDAMMRPCLHTDEPDVDATALMAWLAAAAATAAAPPAPPPALIPPAPYGRIQAAGWRETVLRFGPGGALVGVLCEPEAAMTDFAVVIGNAGGTPRHGFARFGVELARGLAAAGHASLRMDFAGLGDSAYRADDAEARVHVFDTDRAGDITAAIDALERRGYRRFAAHGLCSGAYHAVHGALAEPRIGTVLTVNLPWLTMRHERPGPSSIARRCMDTLRARGVAMLLVFGAEDAGLKQFERHFGPASEAWAADPGVAVRVLDKLDHELTVGWMRKAVAGQILRFLDRDNSENTENSP